MKIFKKISSGIITLAILLTTVMPAHAILIFSSDTLTNDSEIFRIGSDDDTTATALSLEFGGTNPESISWDLSQFNISNDLSLGQNQLKDVTIDNLATAPSTPVVGQIYYDTVANTIYMWDGSNWKDTIAEPRAASHVDGTDDIQLASPTQKGLMSAQYAQDLEDATTQNDEINRNTIDVQLDLGEYVTSSVAYLTYDNPSGTNFVANIENVEFTINDSPTTGIALTGGIDANPVLNYVYVKEDTGSATVETSTTDPSTQAFDYVPIGEVLVGTVSASSATYYYIENLTNYIRNFIGDTNNRLRVDGVIYLSGITLSTTGMEVSTTVGSVIHMHETITYPIKDTTTDDMIDAFYNTYGALDNTNYDDGAGGDTAIGNGKYHKIFIWGDIYGGLHMERQQKPPTSEYTSQEDAAADADAVAVNSVPGQWATVGFPIAHIVLQEGDADILQIIDLRTGGGSGGGGSAGGHSQNTDVGTSENTFTLDSDDTGGNVSLTFGTALAESLLWDNANTRFTLSDDVRTEGNLAVVGQVYIAADHVATDSDGILNIGRNGSAWETFQWNDTANEYQLSDDLNITGGATLSGALDANGVVTIGDGGENVTIDSSVWDITAAGVASGFTGFTSTGTVDLSGATSTIPSLTGTTLTLDSDNTGAGADVTIVAEQGTDLNGGLRYNATDNKWEISNDGAAYAAISTGGSGTVATDSAALQIRRSTTYAIEATWADVTFDQTDLENLPASIQHDDTNTDQIDIGVDGNYLVTYDFSIDDPAGNNDTSDISARVRLNDTSVINGSESTTTTDETNEIKTELTQTFIIDLDDGDSITLQMQRTPDAVSTLAGGVITVHKLEGIQGEAGNDGSTDEAIFTIDNDNAGAGTNVDLVANQGSDNNGTIRYNATTNEWELSNDGGGFSAIATGAGVVTTNLATAQIRRTTDYTLTNAFVDITFNTTDVENDATVIEHDNTNTDQIDIKEAGIYLVSYKTQVSVGGSALVRSYGQVRKNDTNVIPGSESEIDTWYDAAHEMNATFVVSLATNDYLTLQLSKETTADAATAYADTMMVVTKLEGVKGDDGPAGPSQDLEGVYTTDTDNTLTTSDAAFTINTGTSDFIITSNDWSVDATGNLIANNVTANGTLDANGVVTIGDNGDTVTVDSSSWNISSGGVASGFTGITSTGAIDFNSAANITIPHTNSAVFTLDNDNAGAGANVDLVANQGSDSDGTLRYNATDNIWQLSNNAGAFRNIGIGSVFYTYDDTGGVSITGTEITLNLDTTTETITDADYTFSAANNTVEFNQDGVYKISANVGSDTTNTGGAARGTIEIRIQEDPLGATAWADIPGALSLCYQRETTSNSCNVSLIRSFSATDEIRIRLIRIDGTTNTETEADGSHILIERVR